MTNRNYTIEVSEDVADDRADALFSKLMRSISFECGNWSNRKRRCRARYAVALGLVNNEQEFYRMFPYVKKTEKSAKALNTSNPSQQNAEKKRTLEEWKHWCEEHCVEGEVDMNILKRIYNDKKIRKKQDKIKKRLQRQLAKQSHSEVEKKPKEQKCRQRQYGVHSQITKKAWGSAYRPAYG